MKKLLTGFYFAAFIVSLAPSLANAQTVQDLDQKIHSLYEQVGIKFSANSWYKNSANPDLTATPLATANPPIEFSMLDEAVFNTAMKSYCVLMESPQAVNVANPDHFSIMDYGMDSRARRLYIYDIQKQEVVDNTWSSHAKGSSFNAVFTLADVDYGKSHPAAAKTQVLNYDTHTFASFFSNENNSFQSTAGMAIVANATYYSSELHSDAVRMNGVDGVLNSLMEIPRGVVLHPWPLDAGQVGQIGSPFSEACVVIQKAGYYRNGQNANIFDTVRMNFMGGPILLYHPNLDPNTNETTYQSELATYASLSAQLESNWKTIASQYNINSNDSQRYLQVFQKELAALKTKIEATHQYFQTASQYVGKNPNDIGKCINELGL